MSQQRDKVWKDLRNDVYATQSEVALCNGVVFPILSHYGWNVFDVQEVIPQYGVGGGKVDYCLKVGQKLVAFIEAKRASEDLRVHQEQLLRYSFEEGVNIAILTNGWLWWFYLPLTEGTWEQRKFLTIDIKKQADETIDEHFRTFLEKTALVNGSALEAARKVHSSRAKRNAIRQALPTAWLSLIEEQHEAIVDLLTERVESLCGHSPDPETVSLFLSDVYDKLSRSNNGPILRFPEREEEENTSTDSTALKSKERTPKKKTRKPLSFTLLGQVYPVSTSREVLVKICDTLWELDPSGFKDLASSDAPGIPKFVTDPNELHSPHLVAGSGLYVELNRSSLQIERQTISLAKMLGYVVEIEWK